jgi:hypothetical protein
MFVFWFSERHSYIGIGYVGLNGYLIASEVSKDLERSGLACIKIPSQNFL